MKLEAAIHQKNFKNPYHKLVLNFIYTTQWLTETMEEEFKKKGISGQQFNVLRILRGQYPKPASIKLIKERLLYRMPDVSRLIERLRLKGLVTRTESTGDRRMTDIKITEKGLELLSGLDLMDTKYEKVMGNISEKEAQSMNDLMDRIRG